MTKREVLRKALRTAMNNGYKLPPSHTIESYVNWAVDELDPGWPTVIFNKDFAKALWGDTPRTWGSHYEGNPLEVPIQLDQIPAWQYHLQTMVIADKPLTYLEDNM